MSISLTRRLFVALLPSAAFAGTEPNAPSEVHRYTDRTTEFQVLRLTDPAHSAWLPSPGHAAVPRRSNTLLYASDRSGSLQAWRMDLHSGHSRQLTDAQALDRTSLTLTANHHSFCFIDGRNVALQPFDGGRARVVYRVPDTHEAEGGFGISADGTVCTLAEKGDGHGRLRLIHLPGNTAQTLFEIDTAIESAALRPDGAELLYRTDGALWIAPLTGGPGRKLGTAPGDLGPAYWSATGTAVLYLSLAEAQPGAIRQINPDTGVDQLVVTTTRFVAFSPNINDTVFVGASGSKASPYLVLALRSVRRELSLCEHRASDPRQCDPMFSPDTQRVFFVSDGEGRPAIYAMNVDRLLEKTED